jgi:FdhD protein
MPELRSVGVTRVRHEEPRQATDCAAVEEPLEVRLNGQAFAVIMRTPGADEDLAAGFLYSEGVLKDGASLYEIGALENIINIRLASGRANAGFPEHRRVLTNSSCGLCGRVTIASLRTEAPPIDVTWTVDAPLISRLPSALRASQSVFDETGGLHAAGLFDREGALLTSAEDVGRHNAVDKVIGRMLRAGRLPLRDSILFVSGRTSFEIVQKAVLAGVPIVGAVSAPSTLAIDLAAESGVTLLGFVRDGAFNIYSHEARVRLLPPATSHRPGAPA